MALRFRLVSFVRPNRLVGIFVEKLLEARLKSLKLTSLEMKAGTEPLRPRPFRCSKLHKVHPWRQ